MYRYRRPYIQDLIFVFATVAGWHLLWVYLHGTPFQESRPHYYNAFVLWTLFTGFATVAVLYWIDYFRPFKVFKFVPDLLSVFLVLPLAGLLSKPIASVIFQTAFLRSREILIAAFAPALLAVVVEGLGRWAKGKSSVKSTVYLALTPGEIERFMETIHSGGWEKLYRVLSQEEFNGALATGGRVDYVIVSRLGTKNFIAHQNILQAQMNGVTILDYRTLHNQLRGHISIHDIDLWTFLAGSVRQSPLRMLYRGMKFYLEPIVAALMLVMLSPIFVLVAIAIKFTSPGPVFFRQTRTGYLGVKFELIKFRSMRTDAEAGGARWATKTDNRVTAIGNILRKTRLDELPQLWNVVRGEMSFMGPRPERPEFYEIISKEVPAFKLRLLVRPGITGWAQLLGGYAASIEESERKLEYDLYYMQYLSPRMDLIIIWRTILILLKGDSGR